MSTQRKQGSPAVKAQYSFKREGGGEKDKRREGERAREGENKGKIISVNSFKRTEKALVKAPQIKSSLGLERMFFLF